MFSFKPKFKLPPLSINFPIILMKRIYFYLKRMIRYLKIKVTIKNIKIKSIEDLSKITALTRPGPLEMKENTNIIRNNQKEDDK